MKRLGALLAVVFVLSGCAEFAAAQRDRQRCLEQSDCAAYQTRLMEQQVQQQYWQNQQRLWQQQQMMTAPRPPVTCTQFGNMVQCN